MSNGLKHVLKALYRHFWIGVTRRKPGSKSILYFVYLFMKFTSFANGFIRAVVQNYTGT